MRSSTRSWAVAAAWMAQVSCARPPSSRPDAPGPEHVRPAETSADEVTLAELPPGKDVSFRAELGEVVAVRGLPELRPVRGRTIAEADLVRHLEATLRADIPPRAMEGTGELLVALGVAPLHFDYEATMVRLLRSDLAGLYDPRLGAMFLREELAGDARRATLLHELVHALQDQHYDLQALTRYTDDSGDRLSALSTLAEGDATSAMFDGMLASQGKTALDFPDSFIESQFEAAADPGPDPPPPLFRRSLIAPYLDGLRFVRQLRERGGFAEVDRVWRRPPATTEQVLHLDKYDAGEPAVLVELPAPPPADGRGSWGSFFHDVAGEQSLRLVLEEWMPRAAAAAAAAGWGGDRLAVFERGTTRAAAWVVEADDAQQAAELFHAALGAFSALPREGAAQRPHARCALRGDRGAFAVGVRGSRVVWAAGPYALGNAEVETSCDPALGWVSTLLGSRESTIPGTF